MVARAKQNHPTARYPILGLFFFIKERKKLVLRANLPIKT
jgi:hypothetical protein